MSSDDTYKNFIRDLVFRIRENGANAIAHSRAAQDGREFQQGRAMAYVEILSMMQNQADVFQIDRDPLLLSGFDPVNDPLDPPRPYENCLGLLRTFAVRFSGRPARCRVVPALPAIVALMVGFGCGSRMGAGAGSGSVPFDMWGTQIVAAGCKKRVACGVYPDLASCVASTPNDVSWDATLKVDIANGTVVYDPVAAASCVALYNGMTSCLRSQFGPATEHADTVCGAVFLGTVPGGGACFFSEECASAICLRGCTYGCCPGVCAAVTTPIPVGDDCSQPAPGQDCVSGAVCGEDSVTGLSTCVAQPTTLGAACTSGVGCGWSLYCDADAPTWMGTCKQTAPTGGACPPPNWEGCDDARDSCDPTSSVCAPPAPVGGACDPTAPRCVGDASCNGTTSTCQADAKLGEACSSLTGPTCLTGLACNTTTLTCIASLPATGAACM